MANAKDKLEINIHLIRERASRIIKLADEYNRVGHPDYGHIGDLVHVNAELMEIIQFLEREEVL